MDRTAIFVCLKLLTTIFMKKYLPHILIIVGFLVLAFIYAYPQLTGKVLMQGDVTQWKAMSQEGRTFYEKTGEQVIWSNSMFGGNPTYTYYVPYTNNYPSMIHDGIMNAIGKPANFMFAAMLCFYLLMHVLGMNRWVAVVGAIAYAFSTYNPVIIEAGHDTKMYTIAYMPGMLAGLILLYKGRYWLGMPVLAIPLALMISKAHYQVIYYCVFLIMFVVITYFFILLKKQNLKQFFIASGLAALIAVIALGPSMQMFMASLEYNKTTMRGGESELTIGKKEEKKSGGLDKEYAFRWSNSLGETFCILVPMLYGGATGQSLGENSNMAETLSNMGVPGEYIEQITARVPLYWGPQPFVGGPMYFGAIVCFLFVLGLLVVRSKHKWWIVAMTVMGIVMSWGNHFPALNYFLFDHLPGLNKFRVPSTILVMAQFMFPILGMWALNDIIKGKLTNEEIWKHTKLALIITAGLCVVLAFGSRMVFDFRADADQIRLVQQYDSMLGKQGAGQQIADAVQQDRADLATKSALTSAVYILLAGALIWAYSRKKVDAKMLIAGIGLLIAVDLFTTNSNYLNEDSYVDAEEAETPFLPRQVDQQILQDKDPYYRVLDVTKDVYNDASGAYFHKMVGGYSPAKMEIYQDLIDVHMSGKFNAQVLNMLNTKYIIFGGGNNGEAAAMPNPDACGPAWFVSETKMVNTADEEITSLNGNILGDTAMPANAFDAKKTVVLRKTYDKDMNGYSFGKDSAASIQLTKYGLQELEYASNNSQNGVAVFSDIYYPHGWTAYVDGKETPIMKANYVLRAIKVPAGQHKIEFKFHPETFYSGEKIAMVSSILLLFICVGGVAMAARKRKEDKTA